MPRAVPPRRLIFPLRTADESGRGWSAWLAGRGGDARRGAGVALLRWLVLGGVAGALGVWRLVRHHDGLGPAVPGAALSPGVAAAVRVVATGGVAAGVVAVLLAVVVVVTVRVVAVLRRGRRERAEAPEVFLRLDDVGIARVEASRDARHEVMLARWGVPFGLTVLEGLEGDERRARLAFTSDARTSFVAVTGEAGRLGHASFGPAARAPVLGRFLDGPDSPARRALDVRDACALLRAVEEHPEGGAALRRIILHDARGRRVVLDGDQLRVDERSFDLAAPVEWCAFRILEGSLAQWMVLDGTWVRQGANEAVLVSPAAARDDDRDDAPDVGRISEASLGAAAALESALAPGMRVAIEPLFLPRLRRALAGAPRRKPSATSTGRRRDRDSHPA